MRFIFLVTLRFCIFAFTLLSTHLSTADEIHTINVTRGFSTPLKLSEDAGTIAIGDPNLIGVITIKPNLLMVNGQEIGATSLTVFSKSGVIYQYRIQISNDIAQLRTLIFSIEKNVTVEDVGGTIVLKGEVPTPAALAKVLSIADRFAGGDQDPSFSVISDRGGVLAGNLNEKKVADPVKLKLATQEFSLNGGGGSSTNGSNGGAVSLDQKLMNDKGNLAQNISRAGVVMVAKGKVMSLIKIKSQPRVEIQMRIVAVDRVKTEELGINWRLQGNKVDVVSIPSPITPRNPANLIGIFNPGEYLISAFLRAIEEKGAATMLSEPLLTAVSGESASFLVGGSIPIPVEELSPGNATSNAVVTTNVEFIEYGLRLIIRPTVLESGKISITLDQSISEPDYSNSIRLNLATIPAFRQKSISTITESESGESWAVAGLLSEEDSKNLKSVPWISKVPVIGFLFRSKDDKKIRNELMVVVNARLIEGANSTTTSFDGIGMLAPTQANPDTADNELINERKQVPSEQNKPSKTTKPLS